MRKAENITHYKVQCIDEFGNVDDDCVDDMIFDDYDEAQDYANDCSSCASVGREIMEYRYQESRDDEDCPSDYEYIVV